jgi:hypothetical protein
MMDAIEILRPAVVLAAWTLVMLIWLVATRIPALSRAGIEPQASQVTAKLDDLLPNEVQRVARNYNHLLEQPTVFYAVAIIIAVLGDVDPVHV